MKESGEVEQNCRWRDKANGKIYVGEGTQLERAIYLQIVEQAQIIRKY